MAKTILVLTIGLVLSFLSIDVSAKKCYTCLNLNTTETFCKENVADEAHVINCEYIIDGLGPLLPALSSGKINFNLTEIMQKSQNRNSAVGDVLPGCMSLTWQNDYVLRTCSPENVCDLIKDYPDLGNSLECDYCDSDHCNSSPKMFSLTISVFFTVILSAFIF